MENSRNISHSSKTYITSNYGQYLSNPRQCLLIPIQILRSISHLDSGADQSCTAPLQSSVSARKQNAQGTLLQKIYVCVQAQGGLSHPEREASLLGKSMQYRKKGNCHNIFNFFHNYKRYFNSP